jgi:hypothetical protein
MMEALPDFGLPAGVEAFDSGLKACFPRRRKDWGDPQAQAQSHDPADSVRKVVGSLKAGIVVELRIGGKAKGPPVLDEGINDFGSRYAAIRPRGYEAAVKRDAGEDIHMDTPFNHQVFDYIKAIEFALRCGHVRQVPARRWRPVTHSVAAIKSATPFQDSANGANRGRVRCASTQQVTIDCRGAIFAQSTRFLKLAADCQHKILHGSIGALNCMWHRWTIAPVNLIERLTASAPNPVMYCTDSDSKVVPYFTHRRTMTDSRNHSPSLVSLRAFLTTFYLPLSFCQTITEPKSYAKVFKRLWQSSV